MIAISRRIAAILAIVATIIAGPAYGACIPGQGLGVSRVIDIDTSTGPLFGDLSRYPREATFLGPKEVVLTFDDGPMPWITKSILDTLDSHCTRATFFSVGRMAVAYPASVRDVMARGHTVGTHTWSHPLSLRRLNPEAAIEEVERGFAAVALAAGQPIAPFFRFPGLNDNAALLTHLQSRGVGSFTVDVVSNDSYIPDAARLAQRTLAAIEARGGGIVLFHDIKVSTARALPEILNELNRRGYKVVHLRSKHVFEPLPQYQAALGPVVAKAMPVSGAKLGLVPFYAAAPRPVPLPDTIAVAALASAPKIFTAGASEYGQPRVGMKKPRVRVGAHSASQVEGRGQPVSAARVRTGTYKSGGWVTTLSPIRRDRRASADAYRP